MLHTIAAHNYRLLLQWDSVSVYLAIFIFNEQTGWEEWKKKKSKWTLNSFIKNVNTCPEDSIKNWDCMEYHHMCAFFLFWIFHFHMNKRVGTTTLRMFVGRRRAEFLLMINLCLKINHKEVIRKNYVWITCKLDAPSPRRLNFHTQEWELVEVCAVYLADDT